MKRKKSVISLSVVLLVAVAIFWLVKTSRAERFPAKGEPLFAYYDPPWTPVFLRRNEVMIRLTE